MALVTLGCDVGSRYVGWAVLDDTLLAHGVWDLHETPDGWTPEAWLVSRVGREPRQGLRGQYRVELLAVEVFHWRRTQPVIPEAGRIQQRVPFLPADMLPGLLHRPDARLPERDDLRPDHYLQAMKDGFPVVGFREPVCHAGEFRVRFQHRSKRLEIVRCARERAVDAFAREDHGAFQRACDCGLFEHVTKLGDLVEIHEAVERHHRRHQ